MKATISFVEYLFTGTLATAWLWLLIPDIYINKVVGINGFLLIPFLYAIGMLIDFVSMKGLKHPKKIIRKRYKDHKSKDYPSTTVAIIYKNSDLGHETVIRSSRDRIARGIFTNLIFISVCLFFTQKDVLQDKCLFMGITLTLTFISFWAWVEFQDQASHFKYSAIKFLENEENNNNI